MRSYWRVSEKASRLKALLQAHEKTLYRFPIPDSGYFTFNNTTVMSSRRFASVLYRFVADRVATIFVTEREHRHPSRGLLGHRWLDPVSERDVAQDSC